MKNKINTLHFVGIGGSGMSGIAEVLLNQGFIIQGSDKEESPSTRRLKNLGAKIFLEHDKKNIEGADVCVVSSAIKHNNPELIAARKEKIPVVPRALMLGELMRFKKGIAIAGSHGKTTTTSLISHILAESDFDPTYVIGGKLSSDGIGARLGKGNILVAEADESDGSFLSLSPFLAAVTNIDRDHLEFYGNDFNNLKEAFISFIHRLPFYSSVVLCIEDKVIREIIPLLSRSVLTVGLTCEADIQASDIKQNGVEVLFKVTQKNYEDLQIKLSLPGSHNILNALVAIGIARELEVKNEVLKLSLENFTGVERRFQFFENLITPTGNKFSLVDDYGHHPTEVLATLNACRESFPARKITLIFQPHRYSRTRDLFGEFVKVLAGVDRLILLEVYPAGEVEIENADSRSLLKAIKFSGCKENSIVSDNESVIPILLPSIKKNDLILVMGAGSVCKLSGRILLQCSQISQEATNE